MSQASADFRVTRIRTFVVLDLETTGLGDGTCITEIGLVVYAREELLNRDPLRVCNKLVLCMNPVRLIEPHAARISGLSNELLTEMPTFVALAPTIASFLWSFQKPICLIAHNGDSFDFRLLKAELKKWQMETAMGDMLCADSMKAFKCLDIQSSLSSAMPEIPDGQVGGSKRPEKRKKPRKSYSLPKMYQECFGREPDFAHTAEGDCLALLEIIRGKYNCEDFLSWCDKNAQPFRTVSAVY